MSTYKKTAKAKLKEGWEKGSGNVFRDLGFDEEESESLFARATLILRIEEIIKKNGWSQIEAAKVLKVKQPRIAELLASRVDCFSIDLLVKYLSRLGKRIQIKVVDSDKVA